MSSKTIPRKVLPPSETTSRMSLNPPTACEPQKKQGCMKESEVVHRSQGDSHTCKHCIRYESQGLYKDDKQTNNDCTVSRGCCMVPELPSCHLHGHEKRTQLGREAECRELKHGEDLVAICPETRKDLANIRNGRGYSKDEVDTDVRCWAR
jgi:hypothetical protein